MHDFQLVGVLHLPPLPGAVNYTGQRVSEMARAAVEDAIVLSEAGFTEIMIQDASDNPQPVRVGSSTVAAMSAIGALVRREVAVPIGVVVGHNDGAAAVAIAHAIDAQFVRVKVLTGISIGPSGWIQGCSLEVARMKRLVGSDVQVWADVHEATSAALIGDTSWASNQAVAFGGADKLIVTRDSGVSDALEQIAALKRELSGTSVLVGGRVTELTLPSAIKGSDGAILGTVLKGGSTAGCRIDPVVAQDLGSIYREVADLQKPTVP